MEEGIEDEVVQETEQEVEKSDGIASIEDLKELANSAFMNDGDVVSDEQNGEAAVVEDYTPDFTYKVRDEEHEFDERFRDVIKSKEDEEALRELYTRSAGLDHYKTKFSERDSEYQALENQAATLIEGYKKLQGFKESGDLTNFQKAFGFTDDQLIDYAISLTDHQALPEDQRRIIDENRTLQEKLSSLESTVTSMQTSETNQNLEAEIGELKNMLLSEQYKPAYDAFESRGINMVDKILEVGVGRMQVTGVEPNLEDIVKEVASMVVIPEAAAPVVEEQINNNQTVKVVERKKTLPSISGGGAAPVSSKITSLDQLKALANQIPVGLGTGNR